MYALFSPESLQFGALKGLKTVEYALMCAGVCVRACACVFSGTVKRIDHIAFWVWWDS